jgi:hypothetical protein
LVLTPAGIQLIALAMTLVLEVGGAALYWLAARRSRLSPRRLLLTVAAINLLTHPLLWLALNRLPSGDPRALVLAETIVAGVEALVYWRWLRLPLGRAAILSLLLNLCSWLGGMWLWQQ